MVRCSREWLSSEATAHQWLSMRLNLFHDAGLKVLLDGDGKFLFDPREIDRPYLADEQQRQRREDLLCQLVQLAATNRISLVSFSVGKSAPGESDDAILCRLAASIQRISELATRGGVECAIQPQLGAVIETGGQFERLLQWLPPRNGIASSLSWTADISVMARRGELPIGDRLARHLPHLACVTFANLGSENGDRVIDCRFGEGDLDLQRIAVSLKNAGYHGWAVMRCEGVWDSGLELAEEAIAILRSP